MKLLYVLLVLMSYCSLSCCGIPNFPSWNSSSNNKSALTQNKIQNLAAKYEKRYKALPKDAVFTEIKTAISNWGHLEPDTRKSILAVLEKMFPVEKEYVEYLNKMFENVNKARDNSLQNKLNEVTGESAPENSNSSKELLHMISERKDWRTTRNVLKYILGRMSDLREDMSVTVWSNENNDTMLDQLANNVITSYNNMAQEKLSEMNKNIESQQYTTPLNDQNVILELEDMISDTTQLKLDTQRMIAKTWRNLVQKEEKNLVILNQQFEESDEKYNESVLKILEKMKTYYFNDDKKYISPDDKIFQKIDETISEANKLKTNDSIFAILHQIKNVNPKVEKQRDELINKVEMFNTTIIRERLSKISKECNENQPTFKYSINSILNELNEMISYVIMTYNLKIKNILSETLQCVVQLVKQNHKQDEKLIKNSNAFISQEVAKKLTEIQIIYSKTQTALSDDDPIFQKLDNMISELNEPEINLNILTTLKYMDNLNWESSVKRQKLIKKAETYYNESIEMQLTELEVRARDARYSTNLMTAILIELASLISENNSIPVNLHLLKILDNLKIQFNDLDSETVRDSLTNKLIAIINKTVEAKFEEISKKYRVVQHNEILPNDEIFDDLNMVITEVNKPPMAQKEADLLEEMERNCTEETCKIISRLVEKNSLCFNKLVQRSINKLLKEIQNNDNLRPEDIVFAQLTRFIVGIPNFRVDTIQLIFKTLHSVEHHYSNYEELMKFARSKYLIFMKNKLEILEELREENPMSMLENVEELIVDINNLETNELILLSLSSMEISEGDILKKRDQLINKVKEDNEKYAKKVIEKLIERMNKKKIHFAGMEYDEFTELGEVISFMHILSREIQEEIILDLLKMVKLASNRDKLIRKWQEKCEDKELKEKYAEKIAEHFAKPIHEKETLDRSPDGGMAHKSQTIVPYTDPVSEHTVDLDTANKTVKWFHGGEESD